MADPTTNARWDFPRVSSFLLIHVPGTESRATRRQPGPLRLITSCPCLILSQSPQVPFLRSQIRRPGPSHPSRRPTSTAISEHSRVPSFMVEGLANGEPAMPAKCQQQISQHGRSDFGPTTKRGCHPRGSPAGDYPDSLGGK